MAIEDFGRSLLSQVHEQRRRQRKKKESYEKKAALASIVVPIGAKAVVDWGKGKAADFLASEEMMARNRQVGNAVEVGNMYEEQEREIQASTLGGPEYFRMKFTPLWQTMGRERYAEEFHGKGPYKELTQTQVGVLADREWDKHQKGLALAREMGSIEDYHTMSALNTKDVRPTNFVDLVGRQLSTVFGGKSTKEREQEAIAAIENSNIFTTAKELNAFHTTYDLTNQLPVAYSYAEFIKSIQNVKVDQFEPKPTENIQVGPGGQLWRSWSIMAWDKGSEKYFERAVLNADGTVKMELVGDISDPKDKLQFNISVWNPASDPRLFLNEKGFQMWMKEIETYNLEKEGEEGYIPLNPMKYQDGEEGLIEYEKLTTLFNQVTLKPGTLKVSEETLLLLNQFFVTLTDINIARGFEEALDEAVDAYATANDIEAVATYNKESTYPDPENPDEKLLYHRNNLTDFQNIIDEITQRKAAYYRGIALESKAISESLQDDGIITTDFDFSALDEIDERDEDEVDEVDEVTLEVDTDAFKTYYQQIKQQHDEGIITDEDWEYFRENGELPPKP